DQPSLADAAAGLSAWVAASGHSLILPDTRRADEFSASARPDSPHDALAVPLLIDERATGVLLAMRRLEASPFSDRDHAVATVLAGSLALAIERARMQETLKRRLESSNFFQRQLEAYALDVRKTYAAEKRRAEELAAALSELKRTYLATVRGLAIAVDAKDQYTAGHLVRVTRYGLMLMRVLEPEKAGDLQFEYGFLLHDIGKLGVPDAVLAKSTPLTGEERELMDRHPEIGRRILEDIPFLAGAKEIVYAHHERWDGEGYPRGLKGLEIPLGARVFPLADCLDAMTTDRPYRKAMPMDQALDEIRKGSGTQFWPEAVEALGSISEEELEAARLGPTEWDPTS
ncbi:MAG: HD-GYP domain-containing protein, partial [Acidimicrobiales bacterium]